jgi:hypothetical protein
MPRPISLKPSGPDAVDFGVEFLALLLVEGIFAICCAMLITPCDTEDSGLIVLALLETCFILARKSLIAIPESLRELGVDCTACDGARDDSRVGSCKGAGECAGACADEGAREGVGEGAGKAPDMTHEAARCDPSPSA